MVFAGSEAALLEGITMETMYLGLVVSGDVLAAVEAEKSSELVWKTCLLG